MRKTAEMMANRAPVTSSAEAYEFAHLPSAIATPAISKRPIHGEHTSAKFDKKKQTKNIKDVQLWEEVEKCGQLHSHTFSTS